MRDNKTGEWLLQKAENVPNQARDLIRTCGKALKVGVMIGLIPTVLVILVIDNILPEPVVKRDTIL